MRPRRPTPGVSSNLAGVSTDERARRLGENEARMREINEQIQGTAQRFGGTAHMYEFLCECSLAGCMERMRMTIADYEGLREHAARFAVLEGHEDLSIERVVTRGEGFTVVEKIGPGRDVAQETDPRRPA